MAAWSWWTASPTKCGYSGALTTDMELARICLWIRRVSLVQQRLPIVTVFRDVTLKPPGKLKGLTVEPILSKKLMKTRAL